MSDNTPTVEAAELQDDIVLPFRTERSRAVGRLVRLGASVDTILSRHGYPDAVNEVLGQALALTAMLSAALKPGGKLSLQTRTDGALRVLISDIELPARLRGYASFDKARVAQLGEGGRKITQAELLGAGHLALTFDPGDGRDAHQGVVPLEGQSLTAAAHTYFRQSEQLPTFIRLAVARHRLPGTDGWHWRAGGLIVQHLEAAETDDDGDSDAARSGADSEDWQRARLLAATVEDHELLDPTLAPERLLLRLFHEEGVRTFARQAVDARCRCSRERVQMFLARFPRAELADMREADGRVSVTCEFCSARYEFGLDEVGHGEEMPGAGAGKVGE
jgi:molecular chaperone Hsp33